MGLDHLYVALGLVFILLCFVLLAIQLKGWLWAREIERELHGKEGGELAAIIFLIASAAVLAQVAVCATIVLAIFAREDTGLLRLLVVIMAQVVLTAAFLIAMARARRLDRGGDPPSSEDGLEGVALEADDTGLSAIVAVEV